MARVPIQVVTTPREARMKSSPVLERFAATRRLAARDLCEKQGRSPMYQLHAKMILADATTLYLGITSRVPVLLDTAGARQQFRSP
jgi:hypothetical protein